MPMLSDRSAKQKARFKKTWVKGERRRAWLCKIAKTTVNAIQARPLMLTLPQKIQDEENYPTNLVYLQADNSVTLDEAGTSFFGHAS